MQSIKGRSRRSLTYDECSGRPISSLGRGSARPRTRGRVYRSIMRKIHLIGLAVFAVFAFSAFAASSAFAVSKFLLKAAEITETIPSEATGELLLEDMNATGKPDILCSGIFDGTIAAGGVTGSIESVLTLSKESLANLVECEAHSTCTNPTDVVAVNLPWNTEVMLTAGGLYYELINAHSGGGAPGYTVVCKSIITIEDTCTGSTSSLLENVTGGVLGEFLETESEGITPPGNCSVGGTGQGLVVGDGLITSTSGALTLSE
jgi:hypothetical protein